MNPLRIALIGYGAIGRVHAMAYRDLPFHYGLPADRIVLAGVATSRAETARQAAAELGCPVWTTDYRELLARPTLTWSISASPTSHMPKSSWPRPRPVSTSTAKSRWP